MGNQAGGSNASGQLAQNQPVNNEPVEDDESQYNKSQTKQKKPATLKSKNVQGLSQYEKLEQRLPLQAIDIREFEGRIKKLVYNKETVSIKQLQYVFTRDYEDFEDLNNPSSIFYKIITSNVFKRNSNEDEMSIQYLLLFGLLYCQGTIKEKAKVLYDVLQDGLQPQIAANDKDLKDCFGRLLEMASCNIHKWSTEFNEYEGVVSGIVPEFEKTNLNLRQWKEVLHQIEEKFLDDVFDVNSRLEREIFIEQVEKKQKFLFSPGDIKKMIVEGFKNV